jgi:hypothetical protein
MIFDMPGLIGKIADTMAEFTERLTAAYGRAQGTDDPAVLQAYRQGREDAIKALRQAAQE